jgi:hypothetical protein
MQRAIPSLLPVAEVQGPYGPLRLLEGSVQREWFEQNFLAGEWKTREGSALRVRSPGQWNRGAGPDFKDAVIEIGGEVQVGDVELHIYREDWVRHGHSSDPAYNNVILHVVLFSGGLTIPLHRADGEPISEWVLGPWLQEDVESVSGGVPGLLGDRCPELKDWISSASPEQVEATLMRGADFRWEGKVAGIELLRPQFSTEDLLHHLLLYTLGVPYNRRVFWELASVHPPGHWSRWGIVEGISESWRDRIHWNSGRPQNRARRRLELYQLWSRSAPGWAERLLRPPDYLLKPLCEAAVSGLGQGTTVQLRKRCQLGCWMQWLEGIVFQGHLKRSLSRRLWVDLVLPFLAASALIPPEPARQVWFHSPSSTLPASLEEAFQWAKTEKGRPWTSANGWLQGLLWMETQLRLEIVRKASA